MRILPIRDLSTRAVTSFDIFLQVLFDGKPPEAFDPSKNYAAGDLVYIIDEHGDIHIYQVTFPGTYPDTNGSGFTDYNLTDVIQKQLETIEKLTGIRSKISSTMYDITTYYYNLNTGETRIEDIPVGEWNPDHSDYCEVYVGGRYIPMSKWELTVATDADGCIDWNGTLVLDAGLVTEDATSVVIRLNKANSLITRMVNRVEVVIEETATVSTLPTTKNLLKPPSVLNVGTSGLTSITANTNGGYTINGTTAATGTNADVWIYGSSSSETSVNLPKIPYGGMLTFSCNLDGVECWMRYKNLDGKYYETNRSLGLTSGMVLTGLFIRFPNGTLYSDETLNLQLESSYEKTDWVKYEEQTANVFKEVTVPYPIDPSITALQYDLYANGVFIPSASINLELDEEGNYVITELPVSSTETKCELVFEFVYSISNEVVLLKQDGEVSIKDGQDRFLVDLSSVDFVNSFQELKVFDGNNVIDPGRYVPSKGRINVPDEKYYFNIGDTIKVSVWTFILPEYASGTVRHNSQSVAVVVDDTLRIGIPFLEWDSQVDDLLVFNDAGAYLSYCKWYLDGDSMQYFNHDEGVTSGDIVDFRLLDADESVQMRNIYIPVTVDDQRSYTVNVNLDLFSFIMLFTTSGEYIPTSKYSVSGNQLIINNGMVSVVKGDRLELIGFQVVGETTTTSFEIKTLMSNKNGQTIFNNPFTDYNVDTDSLLIFNNAGMYVGERFYSVSSTTISLLGSGVDLSEYLEIIRVRNSNLAITIETDDEVIEKNDIDMNDIYGDDIAVRLMAVDLVKYGVLTENDSNFLRTQATDLSVTATCAGVSYPADIMFSGTRCLLAIDTVDPTKEDYGVVAGNTVDVIITARSTTVSRKYIFSILINPRDLTTVNLGAGDTGESLIIPSLQKLMACFPVADLAGVDDTVLAIVKSGADIRVTASLDDGTALSPTMTETLDGEPAINFGDIQRGCTITAQMLVNREDADDYLYKFTLTVTPPWYLTYAQVITNSISFKGLEDDYLRMDAMYANTKHDTTKGNNAIDLTKFTDENGCTIDSVNPNTGNITVTGDGTTGSQFVDIPLLGTVDNTGKYVIAYNSATRSNANSGDMICSIYVTYGTTGSNAAQVAIPVGNTSASIDLGNFTNLTGVNLRIYTNATDNTNIGSNTVSIKGLRMTKYTGGSPVVESFERFTGLEPAPNPSYPTAPIGTGTKTINMIHLDGFVTKSENGIVLQYNDYDMDLVMSGTATADTEVDLPDQRSYVTTGHQYKIAAFSDIPGVSAKFSIVTTNGTSDATSVLVNDSVSNIYPVVVIANGTTVSGKDGYIRIMMYDATENPDEVAYHPNGYMTRIAISGSNIFDFTVIGEVNDNGVMFAPVADDLSYQITGDRADLGLGAEASITLDHEESVALFIPGTYTVVSGDETSNIYPVAFVDLFYNEENHAVGTSAAFTKFTVTEEMVSFEDFKATIGMRIPETADVTTRYIHPQLLRSMNNGSEWSANEAGVLAIPFSDPVIKTVDVVTTSPLYGRATNLINRFDPEWIDSRVINGVSITNNEDGSITITGDRTDESNIIHIQKLFTHTESLAMFPTGKYLVTTGDKSSNCNPYVYFEVYEGDNVLVTSSNSKALSIADITDDIRLDEKFMVAIGIRMETGAGTVTPRTIWPMLLSSNDTFEVVESSENWEANAGGVYANNFVPYFTPYKNPVDITTYRYGYSGDVVVLEDTYKEHHRMVERTFSGSDSDGWSLDSTHTNHVFVLSGTGVIPSMLDTSLIPDIYCDQYTTVPYDQVYDGHNHVTISTDGEICIYDTACATMSLDDWKAKLAKTPITLVYPTLNPTSKELCHESQRQLNEMSGFKPAMQVAVSYGKTGPNMELVYKLRVDTE